jgi:hypothetical protein
LECANHLSDEEAQRLLTRLLKWCQKTYANFGIQAQVIECDGIFYLLPLELKTEPHAKKLHTLLQQNPLFQVPSASPTLAKQG